LDLVTPALVAASAFFVALAFGLLLRYRQVSQRIIASTDLGKDLWSAIESRMKKQDERILDIMGRLEVIQSRVAAQSLTAQVGAPSLSVKSSEPMGGKEPLPVMQQSRVMTQPTSQVTSNITLDQTQRLVLKLLGDKPRTSVEVKELIGKSREHAARLMKDLFDAGLVGRDSSNKPFLYQLTEKGRAILSS
jgi:DNA-binding HxlR family transcriptional regulator